MWKSSRRSFLLTATAVGLGAAGAGTWGSAAAGQMRADPAAADALFEQVERMTAHGPRFTGGEAHRRYVDDLQGGLESYGLTVTRYPVPLDGWWARRWSFQVADADGRTEQIPLAYYRPHSGETPPEGVTAELVYVGDGTADDYQRVDVRGKIVVADITLPPLPVGAIFLLAKHFQPPAAMPIVGLEDYTRTAFSLFGRAPSLELAQQHGAVGMINIFPFPPAEAAGQYSPHQQNHVGLPAVHLDEQQGKRLRDLIGHGALTGTLVLEAEHRPTTVEYLVAELPGSGRLPGALLLGTHTDGQNAIEENGGPALLAMAEYLTRLDRSQRPRDIVFLLSPNHMCANSATVKPDKWLNQHPEIQNRLKYAIWPEHLGAMNWTNNPLTRTYGPTGRSEIAVLGVGNSSALDSLVIDQVKRDQLDRTAVEWPLGAGLYGEATSTYQQGIPTVQYISCPTYLVQVAKDGHLDKIDPALMYRQTQFLTRLATRTLALPG
ncbi:PA domain-containing protein [Streptomyces sp. B1866]|uniref:PA domain-containing protein n=1 Tax=Streptomyces sp. B1866 TaxID=3075431 RepID=UPI00288E9C1A|nr:PA domain-containing protein [Streptomyces sp. B1866]MDT3400151.1 PA domain-containing protein [Streptomyces sp. B1866]